jgi:NADPH-dependent glutamate synthase beta subunit-like oxidoreductase
VFDLTISSNDLDPGFKFEIANVPGNELVKHCFTCGACIAACNYVASDTFEKFGTAPCKAACPAHISIQGFIRMITEGRYRDGLKLIKEEMPFPSICGRICHHPCEMKCNRGKVDEPVAIEYLKRFLADRGLSEDIGYVPETEEKKDEKIAIIGAGPAGLSAAYFLAVKGYPVTVFDKLPVAGGMMAVGIPAYRLPRDILREEIKTITDMGVENLEGIIHGINFLKDISLKGKVSIGERAIVIGGGNVAIDVALTALRSGAKEVQIVCLEGRDEMHAWDYEIKDALDEGIAIINNWGPRRFIGKNGHVKSIEFKHCTAVLDTNGRFNPQYDETELMTLEADNVLLSIGADRPLEWKGIELEPQNVECLDRQQMQRLSIAQRRNSFEEIDLSFSEQQARLEAGRCLRICGTQMGPVHG